MFILEFLLFLLGFYIYAGLFYYVYAVVISWTIVGFWDFKVSEKHVGVFEYYKWELFWLHWISEKLHKK